MVDKIEDYPKGVQSVEHLIVDAGAFIRNANIAVCQHFSDHFY
jgi:hypothetical protein